MNHYDEQDDEEIEENDIKKEKQANQGKHDGRGPIFSVGDRVTTHHRGIMGKSDPEGLVRTVTKVTPSTFDHETVYMVEVDQGGSCSSCLRPFGEVIPALGEWWFTLADNKQKLEAFIVKIWSIKKTRTHEIPYEYEVVDTSQTEAVYRTIRTHDLEWTNISVEKFNISFMPEAPSIIQKKKP